MRKFISKKKAEEVLVNTLYEIKEILNKDLSEVKLRKRTFSEWLRQFGESGVHLKTKERLHKLQKIKRKAENFLLFGVGENSFNPGNRSLGETWIG